MKKIIILFIYLYSLAINSVGWTLGNSIIVTSDGQESQKIRLELINHAQNLILFSPNFCGGPLCQKTFRAIYDRLANNHHLSAYILMSDDFVNKDEEDLLKSVKITFPKRFFYTISKKILSCNLSDGCFSKENHAKVFVVDDTAVMGGSGITESMCSLGLPTDNLPIASSFLESLTARQYRDMDVVIHGPSLYFIKSYFHELFSKWSNDKQYAGLLLSSLQSNIENINYMNQLNFIDKNRIIENVNVKVLGEFRNDEIKSDKHEISEALLQLISESKYNITFAHMNFYPIESIKNALSLNTKKNPLINITLISNGSFTGMPNASKFFVHMNRNNYNLINQVFEYNVLETLYHKKVSIFDDKYVLVGSYNLSKKSAVFDDELAILIDSEKVASNFNKVLEIDKKYSNKLDKYSLSVSDKIFNFFSGIIGNFI